MSVFFGPRVNATVLSFVLAMPLAVLAVDWARPWQEPQDTASAFARSDSVFARSWACSA